MGEWVDRVSGKSKGSGPTERQQLEGAAARFEALSDPTRLKIIQAIREQGRDSELSVGEAAEAAGTSLAVASQHLNRLRLQGLASTRRAGKHVYYRIADECLCEIIDLALSHDPPSHSPSGRG